MCMIVNKLLYVKYLKSVECIWVINLSWNKWWSSNANKVCSTNDSAEQYDFHLTSAIIIQLATHPPHLGIWAGSISEGFERGDKCTGVFNFVTGDFEEWDDLGNIKTTKARLIIVTPDENTVMSCSWATGATLRMGGINPFSQHPSEARFITRGIVLCNGGWI